MVLERFSKRAAATAGAGAGGFAGGFFSSPTFIILGALAVILLFFQGDIRKAFENLGKIDITLPEFPEIKLPEFPEITLPEFPELPDFGQIFADFFAMFGGEPTLQPPPAGEEETPLGTVTTPEGCTIDPVTGIIECPTPPTFDVCEEFPELCEPCAPNEERLGGICRPISPEPIPEPEPPFEEPEPFEPPIELPAGFVGAGISFEGGTIFETPTEFLSLSQIIDKFNVSASKAADILARAKDDFGDFDFGTSTGSGLIPPFDQPIITGGATLESEEKRAACVSCELFGLNCPICAGTI